VLELLTHLLALEWRRTGAALREVDVGGSRVWYAEFSPLTAPRSSEPPFARLPWRRASQERARGRRVPPTLVLLHGLGATGAAFYPIIGALRQAYRVVVPDLPGCGWSRPPAGREFLTFAELLDVAEGFVERVSPGGAYLAGNSMGGWIAAKVAARRPELARGIALMNPGGPALNAEDWVEFAATLAAEDAHAVERLVSRLFHRPPFGMRFVASDIRRMLRAPSVLQLVGSLQAEDFLSEEELAAVDCPSVLIWGENDRLIPDGCRAFFLEKLPRVRYEPVPDCGHCPQLECPRKTAEILLRLPRMRRRARRPAPIAARTEPARSRVARSA
jgi:pimeloyl-ACP methyl ester carboxylesterase